MIKYTNDSNLDVMRYKENDLWNEVRFNLAGTKILLETIHVYGYKGTELIKLKRNWHIKSPVRGSLPLWWK